MIYEDTVLQLVNIFGHLINSFIDHLLNDLITQFFL